MESPATESVTGYGAPVSFISVVIIMELPGPRFEYTPVCSSVHKATGVVASESFKARFELSSTALDSVTAGGPNTQLGPGVSVCMWTWEADPSIGARGPSD